MMEKTGTMSFVFLLSILILCGWMNTVGSKSLTKECSDDFTKVAMCLEFVTGKSAAPSKDCCEAVKDIRKSDPACLCFIIQVTHNGSAQIRNLGIQESKLLQLPSACNLVNSNISDCPKLLHILPNSTDYAIFSNISSLTTATIPNITTSTNPLSINSSSGQVFGPNLGVFTALTVAIFSCISPASFLPHLRFT